jgi:hypothetical protein
MFKLTNNFFFYYDRHLYFLFDWNKFHMIQITIKQNQIKYEKLCNT